MRCIGTVMLQIYSPTVAGMGVNLFYQVCCIVIARIPKVSSHFIVVHMICSLGRERGQREKGDAK